MFDVEHLEQRGDNLVLELRLGDPGGQLPGQLHIECEAEGLLDGQGGVVNVVLLVVDGLSAVLDELLVGKGAVQHLASHARVAVPLVRDGLEERGAAGAGLAQHEDHLARFADAPEAVEKRRLGPLLAEAEHLADGRDDVEEVDEGIREGLDVVCPSAHAPDRQAIPVHPDVLRPDPRLPLGVEVSAQGGLQVKVFECLLGCGEAVLQRALLVRSPVPLAAPVAHTRHVGQFALQFGKVGLCLLDRDAARSGRSIGVAAASLLTEVLGTACHG